MAIFESETGDSTSLKLFRDYAVALFLPRREQHRTRCELDKMVRI
jgi:hypothetical protein